MVRPLFSLIILLVTFISCTENEGTDLRQTPEKIEALHTELEEVDTSFTNDLKQISRLVRDVYYWHSWGNPTSIEMTLDSIDSSYSGINLFELDLASEELVESNFFTVEFIKNHEDIYLSMDEKLKTGEIEWKLGFLPNFGSGAEPWCNCQDVPYDEPSPWSEIEIEAINLTSDSGEFHWKWGNVDPKSDWGKFRYYFKVKKTAEDWKIDYLEGLDVKSFLARPN